MTTLKDSETSALVPRDLQSLLTIEANRYKSKGALNLLIVACSVIVFFCSCPIICRVLWPLVYSFDSFLGLEKGKYQTLVLYLFQAFCYFSGNLCFSIFYIFEFPFIEKYKIIKE